jgi:biopolymer transport protein ExbD
MELMMTPMIDVVFLLLVFFLATASFEIVEQLLPGGISDQGVVAGASDQPPPPDETRDIDDCIVRIAKSALPSTPFEYRFNDNLVADRASLVQQIRNIVRVKSDIPIIVHPDDDVPIGAAVDIYDQARASGGLRVYFAAR